MINRRIDHLINLALEEDIGSGDITTDTLVPPDQAGKGVIVAKEDIVLCGSAIAGRVFRTLDPMIDVHSVYDDGAHVSAGKAVMAVRGRMRGLLQGERTALNFLQRLSGIATHVDRFARAVAAYPVRLVDTRKTIPGWRELEKYAVRVGGGVNHRMGLYDGVLIKDNHIIAAGSIRRAVAMTRRRVHHLVKIEVEVDTLDQVREALEAGADVIMLDNMSPEQIQTAVIAIDGRAQVEISGNVSLEKLPELADSGVDLISVGALTHQATAVDLSMRISRDLQAEPGDTA